MLMLFRVRLTHANGRRLADVKEFFVVSHGIPRESEVSIEETFDKVYDKVRNHADFIMYQKNRMLPNGYRMDADVIEFDENFVGVPPTAE